MPTPNQNESEKEFVSRCIPIVLDEGTAKDGPQASAICHSMYQQHKKNMKLETVDITKPINIADVGTWKGWKFTEQDFDETIKNFNEKVCEPYITLNHNMKLTDNVKEFLKVTSLGFISRLWREGKKLYANFKQVPKLIAELIDSGALKQRSIEFYKKFQSANGKIYNNVLEAITFHGADGLPAINTLEDIPKLFKNLNDDEKAEYNITKSENNENEKIILLREENKEDKRMKIELEQERYDELVKNEASIEKFKIDMSAKQSELENFKKSYEEVKTENETLKKEAETIIKLKADMDKQKEENAKKEVETYIDSIIESKKLLPKFRQFKIDELLALKKVGNEDNVKLFKEELESREKLTLKNFTTSESGNLNNGKFDITNYAPDDDSVFDDADNAIKLQMKRQGYTDNPENYRKAGQEIGVISASEVN